MFEEQIQQQEEAANAVLIDQMLCLKFNHNWSPNYKSRTKVKIQLQSN